MGLIKAIFGAKEIEIEQVEVLFHTEAAYFGEHGRLLASNRALGITEKPVIFCLKGHTTPLPLNHRMFAHIWKQAQAQGFIPLEMIKYGSVIENSDKVSAVDAHKRILAVLAEHGQAPALIDGRLPMHADAAPSEQAQAHLEGAARALASMGSEQLGTPNGTPAPVANRDFSKIDVPTYLRNSRKDDDSNGFRSPGFDAAVGQPAG